jgi:23S rRNA (cytidine1920-2'-O)/16S rRNA (cytidine1409-2'-O)-methyltransferase
LRRRLDAELVRRGLARSRGHAVELIEAGRVTVSGAPAVAPGRLVDPPEALHVAPADNEYVSRGGTKLAHALDTFAIAVAGRRVLDAGASTGGFTDCVLQRGAREVVAVDVGHGQLAWKLREDPRVLVKERTNIRELTVDDVDGTFDVIVADLSFISLRTVTPALVGLANVDTDFVVLVKPQFEAGRARVGKGGVIRDPRVRREVVGEVVAGLATSGLGVVAIVESPITGADGNVEVLAAARVGATRITDAEIDRVLDASGVGQAGAVGDASGVGDAGAVGQTGG